MNVNELYNGVVSGEISLSQGLAVARAYLPLNNDELEWVNSELKGYNEWVNVPDYRQIPCKLFARGVNLITGIEQEIEITGEGINHWDEILKHRANRTLYKMYVKQGVELIEKQFLDKSNGDAVMALEGPLATKMKETLSEPYFQVRDVLQSSKVLYVHNALSMIKSFLLDTILKYMSTNTVGNKVVREDRGSNKKVVFVSYCREDAAHQKWVMNLVNDLRPKFNVLIDEDQPLGVELGKFMEESVANADKVLVIATPMYKERADERIRGVGYETSLISEDIVTDQNRIKFIPIIRKGSKETSFPRCLGNRKGLDMTDNEKYNERLEQLIANLEQH